MTHSITLFVDVTDTEQLAATARRIALKGMSASEWDAMRAKDPIGCDLQMVFDPGVSPPGTSIEGYESEDVTV